MTSSLGADDDCPALVPGPGGVPIPNPDPACQEVIKERARRKLQPISDGLKPRPIFGQFPPVVFFAIVVYLIHKATK